MSIFGTIIYLVMGTTVYLLLFKRKFMVEENRFVPKVFVGAVSMFAIFSLVIGYYGVPWL